MSFSRPFGLIACARDIAAVRIVRAEDDGVLPLLCLVGPDDELPSGLDRGLLDGCGFRAEPGASLRLVHHGRLVVLAGLGRSPRPDQWRDAAAAGSRELSPIQHLALRLGVAADPAAVRAAVEGVLLARYRFDALTRHPRGRPLRGVDLLRVADDAVSAADAGRVHAAATALTRDLANSPHNHLSAYRFGELARDLATAAGIEVDVLGQNRIRAERLGALLAVNAGSAAEARVVRLTYKPPGTPTGRLGLVGKGIVYDAGGLALKATPPCLGPLKGDMSGAAAVLAALLALPQLGGTAEVTGYLMCTDNMPAPSATALGDVIQGRSGRTIEVLDTDAEGRLVLSDGISLAVDEGHDAVVDIATLTGSAAQALGPSLSALFGSDERLVAAVAAAAEATGEPVGRLPLEARYRDHLDSELADLRNVAPAGLPDALMAALFLHEFTDGVPWAHLDIAGTGWTTTDAGWQSPGGTGTGARTLIELARTFAR
ncbi:leucyl aminopeptidase family protein [Nocardioides sp. WV_118_6]